MNRENWFTTPIWFDYFIFDADTVAKKCLELRDGGFPSRTLSNVGGWQSVDIKLDDFSEFEIVKNIIEARLVELSRSINPDFSFRLDNVWININERGDCNGKHVHPTSCLSGTIYIQVDENSGKILFHNDYWMPKHYPCKLEKSNLFCQSVTYTPTNGMIIIFPSWIPHEVTPSNSDIPRISISFNIQQN